MERYDIAIIGTGPAGLSAALTAKIRNKKILLLGSAGLSEKVEKAHTVQNYLGLPAVSGADMQQAFLQHIRQMDITITEKRSTRFIRWEISLVFRWAWRWHRQMLLFWQPV